MNFIAFYSIPFHCIAFHFTFILSCTYCVLFYYTFPSVNLFHSVRFIRIPFLVLHITTILNPCRNIDTKEKPVVFGRSYWILLTLTRSVKNGTLSYYVNDILIHNESVSKQAIPGTGTLRLGHSEIGANWYNGFISQLNIYNWAPYSLKQIEEQIQGQHCCHNNLLPGNWLNWTHVIESWTLHGSARVDKGVECTSFDSMTIFYLTSCLTSCLFLYRSSLLHEFSRTKLVFHQYFLHGGFLLAAGETVWGRVSINSIYYLLKIIQKF